MFSPHGGVHGALNFYAKISQIDKNGKDRKVKNKKGRKVKKWSNNII